MLKASVSMLYSHIRNNVGLLVNCRELSSPQHYTYISKIRPQRLCSNVGANNIHRHVMKFVLPKFHVVAKLVSQAI